MGTPKKVGIGMAVYQPNSDHFYKQLESIQNQTYREWITVMCFDSPVEIYLSDVKFEKFRKDQRFIWLQNPERLGVKKNFERAISECVARGVDYVACSDQDDIWYPEKVEMTCEELSRVGPLSLVHSDMNVFTENEPPKVETAWDLEHLNTDQKKTRHFLIRNIVAGASMMFDAELARRYPVIPESVPYHDHWFAMVASAHGGIYSITKPLYAYRQHSGNVLGTTEFVSTFSIKRIGLSNVADKCVKVYTWSRALAKDAERAHLIRSPLLKFAIVTPLDFGISFLGMGLVTWPKNKPLARAYFARAIGKTLFVLGRR
jgi:hypothetical protein